MLRCDINVGHLQTLMDVNLNQIDSHHGTRACLDLLEMSSSLSAESDIFMFPGTPPERLIAVVWLVAEGGRRRPFSTPLHFFSWAFFFFFNSTV